MPKTRRMWTLCWGSVPRESWCTAIDCASIALPGPKSSRFLTSEMDSTSNYVLENLNNLSQPLVLNWLIIGRPRDYGKYAWSITAFSGFFPLSPVKNSSFLASAPGSGTRDEPNTKLNCQPRCIASSRTKTVRIWRMNRTIMPSAKILPTIHRPSDFTPNQRTNQ